MSSQDGTYSVGVDGCEEVSCRLRLPHLKIEMWGTQFRGGTLRCGPPALEANMDEKWLRERIADIDAEIKKLEHNKANNPTELGALYDKRIATMVEMRKLLEKY